MKHLRFCLLPALLLATGAASAQIITKDQARRTAEGTVNSRANSEVSNGVNAGIDGLKNGVRGLFKKRDKPAPAAAPAPEPAADEPAPTPAPTPARSGKTKVKVKAGPGAGAGQRVTVPGTGASVLLPAGWAYQYLRISPMLPDRVGQKLGEQTSEMLPATTTDAAQLARMNGLTLYRESNVEDQIQLYAHPVPEALSQSQFTAVVQDAARRVGGAPPRVAPATVGAGQPAYRVENAAFGLRLVTLYAFRGGRRYGFSATAAPAKFSTLEPVLQQLAASFQAE